MLPPELRRLLPIALIAAAVVVAWPSRPATGQTAGGAAVGQLRAAVAAEERKIAATRDGLADARRRLTALEGRVRLRQTQFADAQDRLIRARIRLTRLEREEARSQRVLAANLVAAYKAGSPDFVTVVMSANGFADLIERVDFYRRVARRNASILDRTRQTRAAVRRQTGELAALRTRYSGLAKAAIADRDRAAAVRGALLRREAAQLRRRNGVAARLTSVLRRIAAIERRQAAAERAARSAASATSQAPSLSSPSGGGDATVARVVAAANQIASTPYVWGGGHGGASGGYDCSGSISYALAAGGLLSSPLDSTGFESWGDPGPGRRITVYANAGHAFMNVDGRRYDTTALSAGGTRWATASRSTAGFVARHPGGL